MIWESSYWKDSLLKSARSLKKMSRLKAPPEKILVNFEKELFISFYVLRKLIEAKKLSEEIIRLKIEANSYSIKEKDVTLLNWHKVEELYNLENALQVKLDVIFICNQIVHSYVFVPLFDEQEKLIAILFSSDQKRNVCLYQIDISRIIKLLNIVGLDYPSSSRLKWDDKKRDYSTLNESGKKVPNQI